MPKFFVNKDNITDSKVILTGSDINHIIKVLRMKIGHNLEVSDGCGKLYIVKIVQIKKEEIITEILDVIVGDKEKIEVTLYQSLPKLDKMETIIQKCTELGVFKIVPFISERTVVTINDDKLKRKKLERWNKVAKEACKQCQRITIPQISNVYTFEQVLEETKLYNLSMMAYEKAQTGIKHVLRDNLNCTNVCIIIGPEGGFSDSEVKKMIVLGVKPISLGKRILRTETAGMATLCMIMYELEDINK